MKVYTFIRKQFLPISIEEAWLFFSSPANLVKITPPYMKFTILHQSGNEKMYPGQIIRYSLFVLPFLPLEWTTEITHVHEPHFFVDEQRSGPYAIWHHQHHFKSVAGGIKMTDEVHYAIPFGFLGRLSHKLFVRRQLNAIFDYRYIILNNLFNTETLNSRKSA